MGKIYINNTKNTIKLEDIEHDNYLIIHKTSDNKIDLLYQNKGNYGTFVPISKICSYYPYLRSNTY